MPDRVNVHDFADKELGKAAPYGVYDVTANTGFVVSASPAIRPSSPSSRSGAGATAWGASVTPGRTN